MWEFKNRNTFGATAFSTYGGFWIGLFLWVQFVAPHAASAAAADHDLGWILLAFAIFNTYMLLMSTALNLAVFTVFLTLEITEIVLFIGNFAGNTPVVHIGGYIGVPHRARGLVRPPPPAVSNGMVGNRIKLPVGPPLLAARPHGVRAQRRRLTAETRQPCPRLSDSRSSSRYRHGAGGGPAVPA